jgi:hypothetical protein
MRRLIVAGALLLAVGSLPAQGGFPPGALGDDLQTAHYDRFLKAMREPSLWVLAQRDPRVEAYRFLWLRGRNRPISVRLGVRNSGSGWINRREITGTATGEPGHIITYGVSWLTHAKTQSLIAAFTAADFWNLPTQAAGSGAARGLDDSQWILEAVQNGRYHVVERTSPGPNDPVRAIGALALELARFRIRPADIH